tara:strand:+ start:286 stop:1677 length:1392 start_codon:yes stop_codon:yes gene_type:complete
MKLIPILAYFLPIVMTAPGDIVGPFTLFSNQINDPDIRVVAYGGTYGGGIMGLALQKISAGDCSNYDYFTPDLYWEETDQWVAIEGQNEWGLFAYNQDGVTKQYLRSTAGGNCGQPINIELNIDAGPGSWFKTCNPVTSSTEFYWEVCDGLRNTHITAEIPSNNIPTTSECKSLRSYVRSGGWRSRADGLKTNQGGTCTVGQSSFSWTVVSPPSPPAATSNQDPHLVFANGARADFRGYDDGYFNFISYPHMSLNIRTQKSTFNVRGVVVEGTFITEAFINGITSDGKAIRLEHSTLRANDKNWGWKMVNGTCDDKTFYVFPHGKQACGQDFKVSVDASSSDTVFKGWRIRFHTNYVYNHIGGASKRIDLKVSGPRTNVSHGILGQSFNKEIKVLHGKLDKYPQKGTFKTSAQAEGAIQGNHHMYVVSSPYDNNFKFSKYYDSPSMQANVEILESFVEDNNND